MEGFGADGPDGCYPGELGAGVPLVSEIEPLAGADLLLDGVAVFEGEESVVADEQGGVGLLKHGDGVSWVLEEGGLGPEELAEKDLGVGEGAARGGIDGYGFYCAEGMSGF